MVILLRNIQFPPVPVSIAACILTGLIGCSALPVDRPLSAEKAQIERVESERLSSTSVKLLDHPLRHEKIGYLDILPLPPDYPSGLSPVEACFTGELFAKDVHSMLTDSGHIFVPSDYLNIIRSSLMATLRTSGFTVTHYPTQEQAKSDGTTILLFAAPVDFYVKDETHAVVELSYILYSFSKNTIIKRLSIREELSEDLPKSLLTDFPIFLVGHHAFNFQPERALLASAARRTVLSFLDKTTHGEKAVK